MQQQVPNINRRVNYKLQKIGKFYLWCSKWFNFTEV